MVALAPHEGELAARVGGVDRRRQGVEIGVDLEEMLDAQVERHVRREVEIAAGEQRRRQPGPLEVSHEARQRRQPFGVVVLGVGGFGRLARKEVVERGDPGRDGVAAHDALHGGQPRERQEIGDRVHARPRGRPARRAVARPPAREGQRAAVRGPGHTRHRTRGRREAPPRPRPGGDREHAHLKIRPC